MSDITPTGSNQVDLMSPDPEPGHKLGPVRDDWEAAEVWLESVARNAEKKKKGSRATVDTYRHHLNKLRWFCENIAMVTPSRWSMFEVNAYVDFLAKLPAAALPAIGGQRTPFRSQPSESSQSDILRVAHSMFNGWITMGYIRISPMGLQGAARLRNPNPQRAVSLDLYDLVLGTMAARGNNSFAGRQVLMRDRFIFELLRGLGLRASEVVLATMGAFRLEAMPGTGERFRIFVVEAGTAKGGVERMLPVPVAVWSALCAYRAAYGLPEAIAEGEETPLLLSTRTGALVIAQTKVRSAADRRFFEAWTAIRTRQGLYRIVKDRLAATAATLRAEGRGIEAARLEAASPHWLRSTFARAALMTAPDQLQNVAQLMGHAGIQSTLPYIAPPVMNIVAALEQIRPGSIAREGMLAEPGPLTAAAGAPGEV